MVDQQPFHNLAGQGEECGLVVGVIGIRRLQLLDLNQLKIELVHQNRGLPTL